MSNLPLFVLPWYSVCVSQLFFFLPLLFPSSFLFRGWRGWGSGASNVRVSLSWVEGSVYRVNQGCTNPWLSLTFTGALFPINLQEPPPSWSLITTSPAPPNRLIHMSDKRGPPISVLDWGTWKKEIDWKKIPSQPICKILNYFFFNEGRKPKGCKPLVSWFMNQMQFLFKI